MKKYSVGNQRAVVLCPSRVATSASPREKTAEDGLAKAGADTGMDTGMDPGMDTAANTGMADTIIDKE